MNDLCFSFPPVADEGCRVLVLGSMPGVRSLAESQYYAHPQNAFWPILYTTFGKDEGDAKKAEYEARLRFALLHRVAIWDVAKSCLREGSLDADMRDITVNNFAEFFDRYPQIHTVFFNGRQAQSLFLKKTTGAGGRETYLLPSTSPAYTIAFKKKLFAWQQVREAAEEVR